MPFDIPLPFVDQICELAVRAGHEIMAVFNSDFAVQSKQDDSPVTEADRRAERLITETIRKDITDAFIIVGEEAAADGFMPDVAGRTFWLIDPLDGTKEFVKRGTDFTVNIALIENGQPVLGAVHLPVTGETFWGSRHGAFIRTADGAVRPIACRPDPSDGIVAVVSKSHRTPETDAYLKRFAIRQEISVGSSLKFCSVATGDADLYPRLGRTMEWDTAAGHAVLRFAGGSVKTLAGHELSYGKPGFENPSFVASGPRVIEAIRQPA